MPLHQRIGLSKPLSQQLPGDAGQDSGANAACESSLPLAIRGLEEPLVPWAWGINGCASVVSPALATLLAIDIGLTGALWLALLAYGGGEAPLRFQVEALKT
jgi:hypothetical protein